MNDALQPSREALRERIILFLAFLSSETCLEACREHVSAEVLSASLCRLWFDELYVPGDAYLNGLKGDRTDEAVRRFEACFSEEERALLERFHGFFELRIDMAANSARGRAFFPDNDSWRSLTRHAAYVLRELDPAPDELQELLIRMVRQLLQTPAPLHEGPIWLHRLLQ